VQSISLKKVLVANRGEIALRIIRGCQEMGIATVAVYSDVDRTALHVRHADETYYLGPPPARESYLAQNKLIEIARSCDADAVHPGYGFLAENPQFAGAVTDAGLIFIGPSPAAMQIMGDKTEARKRMIAAGVLGYPVLLKAAAGGGGKGMRVVTDAGEIKAAFRAARSEAGSAFADGRIYMEKYLAAPRHIEFQIMADHHGNVVHLGERECSIQRRHQKIIEEAPSPALDDRLREQMGRAAVNAAVSCDYSNAGTVEFMLDQEKNFFFLEMNTRLQVEHPVTEMTTGIDLVKEQLRIAEGQKLSFQQESVQFRGHAIECRIYAEDPQNGFLPSTGCIEYVSTPGGPGVRLDSGCEEGTEVSLYYDPLLAKVIVWAEDRRAAIVRMRRALSEYQIQGVATCIDFCALVMANQKFADGEFDTHFLEDEFFNRAYCFNEHGTLVEPALIGALLVEQQQQIKKSPARPNLTSNRSGSNWKLAGRNQHS
jgi:acetyl/propionyl-CoA carboxylase alpha subunit